MKIRSMIFGKTIIIYFMLLYVCSIGKVISANIDISLDNLREKARQFKLRGSSKVQWDDNYNYIITELAHLKIQNPDQEAKILENEIDLLIPYHPFFYNVCENPVTTASAFNQLLLNAEVIKTRIDEYKEWPTKNDKFQPEVTLYFSMYN
jgi:hypothetical protein